MKGLVHVYTGDGKGKTTSAIGLTIRALGHNKKVCCVMFGKKKNLYGEYKVLKKMNVTIYNYASQYPFFVEKVNKDKLKLECVKGIKKILNLYNEKIDMIVADEILVCVRDKFLSIKDLKEVIDKKPKGIELILTGRCNKKILNQIKNKVDYISLIKKIKHPYDSRIIAKEAVEY